MSDVSGDVSTFFNVEAAAAPDVESSAPASDLFDSFSIIDVEMPALPHFKEKEKAAAASSCDNPLQDTPPKKRGRGGISEQGRRNSTDKDEVVHRLGWNELICLKAFEQEPMGEDRPDDTLYITDHLSDPGNAAEFFSWAAEDCVSQGTDLDKPLLAGNKYPSAGMAFSSLTCLQLIG